MYTLCRIGQMKLPKLENTCWLEGGHICQIEIREVYQRAGVLRQIEQIASLWLCRIYIAVRNKALIGILPWTGSVNTTTEYDPGILGHVCLLKREKKKKKWLWTKHRLRIRILTLKLKDKKAVSMFSTHTAAPLFQTTENCVTEKGHCPVQL